VAPVLEGRDPSAPAVIHEDLYDLMRVRGFFGGFYWMRCRRWTSRSGDLLGRRLGGADSPPCWRTRARHDFRPMSLVSVLPRATGTVAERVAFARDWQRRGIRDTQVAAVVADGGAEG
jgi:galactonate dehydratase